MRIDLHTHSNCSDGTDSPTDLMLKARKAKLDVLALTDHDTTAGWEEAATAAETAGVNLVRGIELSTKNEGQSQHLLAYAPDPNHPGLRSMLTQAAASRKDRIPAMVDKMRAEGINIDLAQVTRLAGQGVVGRPHIADALVESGIFATSAEAWEPYLLPTSPTYVARYTPTIEEAMETIADAGGVTVVAHPWGRKTHISEERFAHLAALGLAGIEVDHQEHDPAARDALRAIARNLNLVITGSSDHHGTRRPNRDLGCNTTDPDEFNRLLPAASLSSG